MYHALQCSARSIGRQPTSASNKPAHDLLQSQVLLDRLVGARRAVPLLADLN